MAVEIEAKNTAVGGALVVFAVISITYGQKAPDSVQLL